MVEEFTGYSKPLTPREKECLQLTARLGKSTLAAKEMGITYQTAKNYLESVRVKLGACNTVQAVYIALNKGVIE